MAELRRPESRRSGGEGGGVVRAGREDTLVRVRKTEGRWEGRISRRNREREKEDIVGSGTRQPVVWKFKNRPGTNYVIYVEYQCLR